jgi:hypothetical protein
VLYHVEGDGEEQNTDVMKKKVGSLLQKVQITLPKGKSVSACSSLYLRYSQSSGHTVDDMYLLN